MKHQKKSKKRTQNIKKHKPVNQKINSTGKQQSWGENNKETGPGKNEKRYLPIIGAMVGLVVIFYLLIGPKLSVGYKAVEKP